MKDKIQEQEVVLEERTEVISSHAGLSNSKQPKNRGRIGEWWRKKVVGLKRRPNTIALIWIVISMLLLMFSTYDIAYANISSNANGGGIKTFWVVLFSILVCVLYMNAYPKRKPVKKVQLILAFIFIAIILALEVWYIVALAQSINSQPTHPGNPRFRKALALMIVHAIFMLIAVVLMALKPVYGKALQKVDTTVYMESNSMVEEGVSLELEKVEDDL